MPTIQLSNKDKLNTLLKGNHFSGGIIILITGCFFAITFIPSADFKSILYFDSELMDSTAIVTKVKQTNISINEEKVLEYHYQFTLSDEYYIGTSFSTNSMVHEGDMVIVEYVSNHPDISRISGMNNAPFELWVLVFTLLLPVIGLGFLVTEIKKLNTYTQILQDYVATYAQLQNKQVTSDEINNRSLYKITYIYIVGQRKYINKSNSLYPRKFQETEMLIYSTKRPKSSVLIKKLPVNIQNKILHEFDVVNAF